MVFNFSKGNDEVVQFLSRSRRRLNPVDYTPKNKKMKWNIVHESIDLSDNSSSQYPKFPETASSSVSANRAPSSLISSAHLAPIQVPISLPCALQKVTVVTQDTRSKLIGHKKTATAQKTHRNEALKGTSAGRNDLLVDIGKLFSCF